MEHKQQYSRCHLSDDCRIGSTLHAHFRHRTNSIDHDGIQNDVYHSTHNLADRGIQRTTGGLQQFLKQRKKIIPKEIMQHILK